MQCSFEAIRWTVIGTTAKAWRLEQTPGRWSRVSGQNEAQTNAKRCEKTQALAKAQTPVQGNPRIQRLAEPLRNGRDQ